MGTHKGHFTKDDADRYTEKHLEVCKWFISNADAFVRRFLFEKPAGKIDVILEKLITSPTSYIIGYADVLLSYRTDQGDSQLVLIEVKTSLGDQAEALRQLQTYAHYLPEITKKCLVHADWRFKPWLDEKDGEGLRDDIDMRRTYSSQGIYVVEYDCLKSGKYNPHYCAFPSGRRKALLNWGGETKQVKPDSIYLFLFGILEDLRCEDWGARSCVFFVPPFPEELWRLLHLSGARPDVTKVCDIPCFIDVEHYASEEDGSAEEDYVAIHSPDMSISIKLKPTEMGCRWLREALIPTILERPDDNH